MDSSKISINSVQTKKIKPEYLYHVSMDIEPNEKKFFLRVPEHRCKGENNTIKRICACPTLKDAVGAFPYKGCFVNYNMRMYKGAYLNYYKVSTKGLNYKTNEEIADLVPDAHITKEHWVLDEFTAIPNIIRISKIKLSNYNKYIHEYYGEIEELEYENPIEDFDREFQFTLIGKFAKDAIRTAKLYNFNYEIIEDSYYHLAHKKFVYIKNNYKGSDKKYRYMKIKFNIPKGKDLSPLWFLDAKQNVFLERKRICLNPCTITKENLRMLREMSEAGFCF